MQEFIKNYKIYEDGEIQRIEPGKDGKGKRFDIVGKFLKPDIGKNGYYRVTLCANGQTKRFLLHRLVALIHLPNPNNHPLINHIDGNPANNHVSNLEWCTYSHNELHSYHVLGKKAAHGAKHYQAKLNDDLVREIKSIQNPKLCQLAKTYNVHRQTIADILAGRTWKHVI